MNTETNTKEAIIINAEGERIGRLAVRIAVLLRGKDTPQFVPYKPGKQRVIVYNTDALDVSQKKQDADLRYWHTGYPGGIKSRTLGDEMQRDSREVLRRAVYGMLPKNKLRSTHIQHLDLYAKALPERYNTKTEEK